jgi:competence protein ComEC
VPQLVISEDARQVAIIDPKQGSLSVNRKRPSAFILEQWQAAYKTKNIILPDKSATGFQCQSKQRCDYNGLYKDLGYSVIYLTEMPKPSEWTDICAKSGIIIAAFAPFTSACQNEQNIIITAQQLALYGSAEIYVQKDNQFGATTPNYKTEFAQGKAARPWQSHRQYSRSARNLGPYKRN